MKSITQEVPEVMLQNLRSISPKTARHRRRSTDGKETLIPSDNESLKLDKVDEKSPAEVKAQPLAKRGRRALSMQ